MEKLTCECNIVHHEVVSQAKADMLNTIELSAISGIFKILGDPTRMKLVWALNNREMCVCDLAATLDMTKSAISHQLKTMKELSVVKSRREGKNIFYSLDDQHITEIIKLAKIHTGHAHGDHQIDHA
ncbi:ArsR/SmtB family transcription factor [Pygmaiobacter massiliensis]|uniref:ArsR/SmtB family transcription factor n=1 Tax=Pygmaiobacter massiliensis TaxID=1917873 RepID=UPI0028981357|nr:metalloregulator ArsR/SmtB family transcription factor [Pygmaiobacter massiliensis]